MRTNWGVWIVLLAAVGAIGVIVFNGSKTVTPKALTATVPPDPSGTVGGNARLEERRTARTVAGETKKLNTKEGNAQKTASHEAPIGQPAHTIEGRVILVNGSPVPDLALGIRGESAPLTRSLSNGTFTCSVENSGGELVSFDDDFTTVAFAHVSRTQVTGGPCLVIVQPSIALGGIVVDELGFAVPHAQVWLQPLDARLANLGRSLDSSTLAWFGTVTDEQGRFSMDHLPRIDLLPLHVFKEGFLDTYESVAPLPEQDMTFVLRRPPGGESLITGKVISQTGEPAGGAVVQFGPAKTTCDGAGAFALGINMYTPATLLAACLRGYQPAIQLGYGQQVATHHGPPPPVLLVLGGPVLTIAGRLVTSDWAPCAGWTVTLADPTTISTNIIPPTTVEGLSAGEVSSQAVTDDDGHFQIGGLTEREYVLQAWDPKARGLFRSQPIQAGAEQALLTVPTDLLRGSLSGQVSDRDGTPLVNVQVTVQIVTWASPRSSTVEEGQKMTTDELGQFVLHNVSRRGLRLAFNGRQIMSTTRDIASSENANSLEWILSRRVDFQVDAGGTHPTANGMRLESASGAAVSMWSLRSSSTSASTYRPLTGGRSGQFSVAEGNYVVIIMDGSEVLSRTEVEFKAGATQDIYIQ